MPQERLDKILSGTGRFSRSEAALLIKAGRVAVDGRTALSRALKCEPGPSCITVDGEALDCRRFRYVIMNKPQGYVCSTEDRREKTVMELLDGPLQNLGLFPAGRLDKDAEGLLLLTNDGALAHEITSPSKKVDKLYFAEIDGSISERDVEAFASGIALADGTVCLPAVLAAAPGGVLVTLREGKYHQVKRMLAAIGKHVIYLKRIAIGGLELDEALKPGEYRELTDEINRIWSACSATDPRPLAPSP